MKKYLKFLVLTLITTLSITTFSYAATKKLITKVTVTDIDAPYSESRTLDTTGEVGYRESYRITGIKWNSPSSTSSGYYEVTVTLKASPGYMFSEKTTGTVNGDNIKSKKIIREDEMSITYAFDENSSTSSDIGNAVSNTRYIITVYCDKERGTITPSLIRVLEGRNQTVNIIPKEGYRIKDVEVDDESVGAVSEYTFREVEENHTLRAYFEEIEDLGEESEIEMGSAETKPLLKVLISIFSIFNT